MDRYFAFRTILDFLANEGAEITEANMCNYAGSIVVSGHIGEEKITITVDMEGKPDGNHA